MFFDAHPTRGAGANPRRPARPGLCLPEMRAIARPTSSQHVPCQFVTERTGQPWRRVWARAKFVRAWGQDRLCGHRRGNSRPTAEVGIVRRGGNTTPSLPSWAVRVALLRSSHCCTRIPVGSKSRLRGTPFPVFLRMTGSRRMLKIVAIMVVRNEADLLPVNVRYHAAQGVSEFPSSTTARPMPPRPGFASCLGACRSSGRETMASIISRR